ncbi:Endonuclease, Uma2 family (restriction endonuclease fold) [Armatimonadetes bacterium GBS]|nr:Endonuclease, Uma2 family (restriction endonuclease fold) [Armatimonadetes bacterium GBS]
MATTAQTVRRKRRYTEEDLKRLPRDGYKYELVNGRIRQVPTGGRHGELGAGLTARLWNHVRRWAKVYDSSTGFRMNSGNIRSPDVSVLRKERLEGGKSPEDFINGAPDLAVEIVSPSERPAEIYAKLGEYFESGAQEVWLIFPERKQVHRYTPSLQVQVLNENEVLTTPLLPDFELSLRELFEEA